MIKLSLRANSRSCADPILPLTPATGNLNPTRPVVSSSRDVPSQNVAGTNRCPDRGHISSPASIEPTQAESQLRGTTHVLTVVEYRSFSRLSYILHNVSLHASREVRSLLVRHVLVYLVLARAAGDDRARVALLRLQPFPLRSRPSAWLRGRAVKEKEAHV